MSLTSIYKDIDASLTIQSSESKSILKLTHPL